MTADEADGEPATLTLAMDVSGTIGDRFLAVADRWPDRQALASPAGDATYDDLRVRAGGVAVAVRDAVDARAPSPVAILATHDGPLVTAILGVILAGHVVVVVDPMAPGDEVEHVLAESGAAVLLHDAGHASPAAALDVAHRIALESIDPAEPPQVERRSDDPCMLAFTSGTSGRPKAATITHAVLLNLVRGATSALAIGPDDRMPMLFPTSLAVAAYPLFIPLLNGGTLCTLDVRSVGLAPVADFLADERITVAYMAPTVVRFLVDALEGRTFPDLRLIALGGELVDAEVVRLTADLFGPRQIANGFGTTETGVIALHVMDADEHVEGAVPTGRAVPDVDIVVLGDRGERVPDGVAGEIAVASPHLFAGYWGRPELSDHVLRPDPQDRAGWQLYRTGDLGRLDGGVLTVLGRVDTKVKVRGRFVVLGDVEADLHEQPEVGDAAVVAVDRNGTTELVAVVAPAAGAALDGPGLRAALLERREPYRVPARFVVVDALPRLPNGKLDRQSLVPAVGTRRDAPPADGAFSDDSRDGITREIRDLWELLLPTGGIVGLDDDFAALGGDSLLAAQMLVMLEQRRGTTVPMSALLEARTVRQLSGVVARLEEPDLTVSAVARVQAADASSRPRLWFLPDLPGSGYRVRHLATALGPDQPVWSVESPLLRGEPNPFTSLTTFVARLLTDIRAEQPDGPYWLAGYSFGGICAYEMAQQLARDGAEVAFLGVVDVGPGYRGPNWTDDHSPPWPYFGVPHPPAEDASPADAVRHYGAMVRRSPLAAARHLTLRTGLARHLDARRFRRDLAERGRVRPEWRLWYAWEEHWRLAVKAWDRATPSRVPVDLLWADQTGSTDATMGWGALVDDLRIHRFPGFHDHLLEAHGAPALAIELRAVLDARLAERSAG